MVFYKGEIRPPRKSFLFLKCSTDKINIELIETESTYSGQLSKRKRDVSYGRTVSNFQTPKGDLKSRDVNSGDD